MHQWNDRYDRTRGNRPQGSRHLGGTAVFRGTRVPVWSLFDHLERGDTLDEFLRQCPSMRREQAVALLDLARETLAADVATA
jgi:uncharacterized protein (DUF433 family)